MTSASVGWTKWSTPTERNRLRSRFRRAARHFSHYRRLHINLRYQEALLPHSRSRSADPASRTHFLINYPGSPSSITGLVNWLPVLHRLSQDAPVAILVGDISAYRAVREVTSLPCYFGRAANEAEYVAQQLHTKVMLYINQARLNLREAGFHDMLHVFMGAPGWSRHRWLNNRMRLYDYVLASDTDTKEWLASRLMSFDAEARVRVVGDPLEDDGRTQGLRPRFLDPNVVDRGVDPDLAVKELLDIRDERDELVTARDRALAAQGIVLDKGGQA